MADLPPRNPVGYTINPQPPGKGPNGRPFCRGCGDEVPKGRRKWCSEKCVHDHSMQTNPGYAASQVKKRDRGICAKCGVDTIKLRKDYWKIGGHTPWDKRKQMIAYAVRHQIPTGRQEGMRWWDMDHIVPVIEGGGSCGLDNLRTLCIPCHKTETSALAARRAADRRDQESGQLRLETK